MISLAAEGSRAGLAVTGGHVLPHLLPDPDAILAQTALGGHNRQPSANVLAHPDRFDPRQFGNRPEPVSVSGQSGRPSSTVPAAMRRGR